MTRIHQVLELAREFGLQLRSALQADEFDEMNLLNSQLPIDGGVCHSHDYCDANMVMEAAFKAAFHREPDLDSDEDANLWNDAWFVAKRAGFRIF